MSGSRSTGNDGRLETTAATERRCVARISSNDAVEDASRNRIGHRWCRARFVNANAGRTAGKRDGPHGSGEAAGFMPSGKRSGRQGKDLVGMQVGNRDVAATVQNNGPATSSHTSC